MRRLCASLLADTDRAVADGPNVSPPLYNEHNINTKERPISEHCHCHGKTDHWTVEQFLVDLEFYGIF